MNVVEWNQMSLKGEVKAFGAFTYDSMGKKLRFRSNESHPTNTSLGLDLLMFFDEVINLFRKTLPIHLMLFATWHLNVSLHLAGDFLRDWQQKPELWEKNTAMHPAPSRYSWWCDVSWGGTHWESIRWGGGIKSQHMDRINARHERWERCYKIIHVPFFVCQSCKVVVTFIMSWMFFCLPLFQAITPCL